jgi:hypothetical protein
MHFVYFIISQLGIVFVDLLAVLAFDHLLSILILIGGHLNFIDKLVDGLFPHFSPGLLFLVFKFHFINLLFLLGDYHKFKVVQSCQLFVENVFKVKQLLLKVFNLLFFWFQRGFHLLGSMGQNLLRFLQVLDLEFVSIEFSFLFLELFLDVLFLIFKLGNFLNLFFHDLFSEPLLQSGLLCDLIEILSFVFFSLGLSFNGFDIIFDCVNDIIELLDLFLIYILFNINLTFVVILSLSESLLIDHLVAICSPFRFIIFVLNLLQLIFEVIEQFFNCLLIHLRQFFDLELEVLLQLIFFVAQFVELLLLDLQFLFEKAVEFFHAAAVIQLHLFHNLGVVILLLRLLGLKSFILGIKFVQLL